MSAKFTPGPWKAVSKVILGSGPVAVDLHRMLRWDVVSAYGTVAAIRDPDEANARLIAAAPDLLACLEELVALVKGECPSLLDETRGGSSLLDDAIATAIAKAIGDSK